MVCHHMKFLKNTLPYNIYRLYNFSTDTAVSKTTQETPNQTFLYPNLIYVSTDEVETQYSPYISS